MSALGQKQTSEHVRVMSALPPKADIGRFAARCLLGRRPNNQNRMLSAEVISLYFGATVMRTFLVLCALALSSCSTTGTTGSTTGTTGTATAKVQMPSELQNAIAEYRTCVDAHGRGTKACEAQRLSMEAEERAYFSQPVGTQGTQGR